MKRVLLATLVAASAVTLAACTATESDTSSATKAPTPKSTITSTPVPGYVPPTGACENGTATISADVEDIDLPGGCANVRIVSSASTITLGPVEHLQIEGNDNQVTVTSAADIALFGDRNLVGHGGEPKIDDKGSENSLKQQ